MKKSDKLRESFNSTIEKLIDAIESESVTQELKDFYKQASRFTRYSLSNQVLILMQDPKATRVAGYKAWMTKFSRYVKKGEHGIGILAPHQYKTKDDDGKVHEHIGFHATTVFDVRQTDGVPLLDPTHVDGDDGKRLYDAFAAYSKSLGMPAFVVGGLGPIDGVCKKDTIEINESLSTQNRIGVLAHEITHHLSKHRGSDKSKEVKEYEAESSAFIVCERFGIRNKAPQYLKIWGATREDIKKSLKVIVDMSNKIINGIEEITKKEEKTDESNNQ